MASAIVLSGSDVWASTEALSDMGFPRQESALERASATAARRSDKIIGEQLCQKQKNSCSAETIAPDVKFTQQSSNSSNSVPSRSASAAAPCLTMIKCGVWAVKQESCDLDGHKIVQAFHIESVPMQVIRAGLLEE